MTKRKQALIAFVVFDLLLAIVFAGLFILRNSPDASYSQPQQLSESGMAMLPDQPALSQFELTDHLGMPFTNQSFKGKWSLVFFGFTSCPDVCPLTMNALQLFYENLESNELVQTTQVVMISVDPERDSVEKMADYVTSYHQDFVGVTGRDEEISKLASQLYIAYSKPPSHDDHTETTDHAVDYEVQHSGYIAFIDPEGNYKAVVRAPHTRQSITASYFTARQIEND